MDSFALAAAFIPFRLLLTVIRFFSSFECCFPAMGSYLFFIRFHTVTSGQRSLILFVEGVPFLKCHTSSIRHGSVKLLLLSAIPALVFQSSTFRFAFFEYNFSLKWIRIFLWVYAFFFTSHASTVITHVRSTPGWDNIPTHEWVYAWTMDIIHTRPIFIIRHYAAVKCIRCPSVLDSVSLLRPRKPPTSLYACPYFFFVYVTMFATFSNLYICESSALFYLINLTHKCGAQCASIGQVICRRFTPLAATSSCSVLNIHVVDTRTRRS